VADVIPPFVDADWVVEQPTGPVTAAPTGRVTAAPTGPVPAAPTGRGRAELGGLVLADVRWYLTGRSGRAEYEAGHIPGALFVDLDADLSAPVVPSAVDGRHPFPEPKRFADRLGALGIGDQATVIGYDDAGGTNAARLVWMLRALGQPAAVLNGGLAAWPGPLETAATTRPASTRPATLRTPKPWPAELLVPIDEVADAAGVMIDGRDRSRYHGGPDPVDPRSGHIPGAFSFPAAETLTADKRVQDRDELRRLFAAVGITEGTPVVSYCGSGVAACLNLLALEAAGLGPGRLYSGSWSQWSRDPKRPLETADPDSVGRTPPTN
jgi:thiosulfate/3-mercaptopyruvate sulfurtransferase